MSTHVVPGLSGGSDRVATRALPSHATTRALPSHVITCGLQSHVTACALLSHVTAYVALAPQLQLHECPMHAASPRWRMTPGLL